MKRVWEGRLPPRTAGGLALVFLAAAGGLFALDRAVYGFSFLFFFLRFAFFVAALYFLLACVPETALSFRAAQLARRIIVFGVLFFLISFGVFLSLMLWETASDDTEGVSFVVVAGAGLRGSEPSLILRQRLDRALLVLEENPAAVAILTGGQGPGEDITEAAAMQKYLSDRGIAADRLYKEEASRDTSQNITNAARILRGLGSDLKEKTAVVTSDFHMFRSLRLAEQNGLAPVAAPAATVPAQWHYYLREYFSIWIYLMELTGLNLDTSASGL